MIEVGVMVVVIVLCGAVGIVIIALQIVKRRKRKELQRRKNKVCDGFQVEWLRFLPLAQALLNNNEPLPPKIAEEAQKLNEKFSALESLLGVLDREMNVEKLSDAESNFDDIVISLDDILNDMEKLKRSNGAPPH